MSEYWDEDGQAAAGGSKEDEEDDEIEAKGSPGVILSSAPGGIDLDAHIPAKGRLLLGGEEPPSDAQVMILAAEIVNTQVDPQKLTDSRLMKFVSKIASSAPSKGHEKRLVVVHASSEFLPGTSVNPSSADFVEVGRTDVAVDDASPTFALPVRVTCRGGMDRLVRIQLLWSQSGMLGGSETVLGQAVERFSDLQAKTANLQPLVFSMSLATACPRGRCLIWRVPMQSLHPPSSPYMCLASKRHVSFSVPYVFRKAGQGSDGSKAPRRTSKTPTDDGGALLAERSVPELMLTKENTIESRFSYRMPSLFFRPFIKQMEAALAAWNARYEAARVQQGYFTTDTEAFAHGRVLVRLSVVEASGLSLFRGEDVIGKAEDFSGVNAGKSLTIPSVSKGSALAQKLVRGAKPQERSMINSNPFVAVIHEEPAPKLSVLVGHTNTEYSTQSPVFGQNANPKLCPHNRPRENFSVCGSTRLGRSPGVDGPCFLFYTHAHKVGRSNLRLELYQEAYTLQGGMTVQLAGVASLSLDAAFVTHNDLDETRDREVWLPLTDKEGHAAGRLLVRLSIFEGDGEGLDPAEVAAKAAPVDPEAFRPCYEWMRLTGMSGRMPREADVFGDGQAEATAGEEKLQIRYPPEWIKAHINSLEQQLQWLQASLRLWEQASSEGRGFRSSELKVTPELQGVPINLHSQTFVVSDWRTLSSSPSAPSTAGADLLSFGGEAATAEGSSGSRPLSIYDLVSTGAPTAHSLGFRRGGLVTLQNELTAAQKDMRQMDDQLKAYLRGPCLPTGPCGELSVRLVSDVLKFEAMAAKAAVRRALVISQALTIAVTSLVTKLDIMLTDDADQSRSARAAANMVQAGYLVCFQGLVSTIGKEQGMQEDVAVSMELASLYSFEIRAFKPGQQQPATSPAPQSRLSPPPASDDLLDFMGSSSPPAPAPRTAAPPAVPSTAGSGDALGLEMEFDHVGKRIRLFIDPAALARLPRPLQPRSAAEPVVLPIVAILFAQGIDAKQTIANLSNQIKPGASTNVGGNSTLQPIINRRSFKVLNDYVHRCFPVPSPGPKARFDRLTNRLEAGRATAYGSSEEFARSIDEISTHPMLEALKEAVKRDNGSFKNVDLLREQERVVLEVGGGQVIFCKSGKDRTGMAVTLHQARLLADRHGTGQAMEKVVHDANVMRLHGTRLLICEKNVGRLKYAFNALQLQFMPSEYRPPTQTIDDMVNSILNRDTT